MRGVIQWLNTHKLCQLCYNVAFLWFQSRHASQETNRGRKKMTITAKNFTVEVPASAMQIPAAPDDYHKEQSLYAKIPRTIALYIEFKLFRAPAFLFHLFTALVAGIPCRN